MAIFSDGATEEETMGSSTLSFRARFLSEDSTEEEEEDLLPESLSLSLLLLLLSLLERLRLLRCRFPRLFRELLFLSRDRPRLRRLLRLLRRRRLSSLDEEDEE